MKLSFQFLSHVSYLTLLGAIALPVRAQITPDNTVGTTVNQNGNVSEITGGETRGSNLFHSFREFSVRTGNEAFFNNVEAISNIFSRVTGGNVSNIDGLIRANGSASLFLINPAGIIFGEGASLDLGGSFYGSSADSILFEDGQFSATDLDTPPLLTINAPIGLSFRDNPEDIVNRSNFGLTETILDESVNPALAGSQFTIRNSIGLEVDRGQTIALLGGNVVLEKAGGIAAPGGRVELGGLSQAGEVTFNNDGSLSFPQAIERGNVSLTEQSRVNVTAGGGGSISVNAKNLTLSQQSELFAGIAEDMGSPEAQAGDITIDATESVRLTGSGGLNGDAFVLVFNDYDTAIRNLVGLRPNDENPNLLRNPKPNSTAVGNAGSIIINTDLLEIEDRASLTAKTYGLGDTDDFIVRANEIIINEGDLLNQIVSGSGDSGDIILDTNNLEAIGSSEEISGNSSFILTDTRSSGNTGNIIIDAAEGINLEGGTLIQTQILEGSQGDAGDIKIDTPRLTATNSFIQTSSSGVGNAGNITINADGQIVLENTLLNAQINDNAIGDAGTIEIDGNSLSLSDNSQIQTRTLGQGDAGDIRIDTTDSVSLSGSSFIESNVDEIRENNNAIGNAGNITITTGELDVLDNSQLTSISFARGNAGSITVDASDRISLESSIFFSNLNDLSSGQFDAVGSGGNISITTQELNLTNGSNLIASTSGRGGNAGNITIDVAGKINLDNGNQIQSQVTGEGEGNAGNIAIDAGGSLFSTRGNLILADSQATGNGGDINIAAGERIVLEGFQADGFPSQISAGLTSDTADGEAGNIVINASELILNQVAFVATNNTENSIGSAGDITISVDRLRLTDNAFVNAFTNNDFDGGAITINAQTLDLLSGGKIIAATDGGGDAGNINLNITEQITIDNSTSSSAQFVDFGSDSQLINELQSSASGIFANATESASGDGGSISIGSPESLNINNNAQIIVNSDGTGSGGEIFIRSDSLTLDDNASITASTTSGRGGNITLEILNNLVLNNNSLISAEATGDADGGNVNIDAEFIIATPNQNSDILASAQRGRGGNIQINAESLFGIEQRQPNPVTNDIDASSDFGLDGTVSILVPDVDAIERAAELPSNIIEPDTVVAQACPGSGTAIAGGSSLTILGKGGIPVSPTEPLGSDVILTGDNEEIGKETFQEPVSADRIVPARGVIVTEDGRVLLTAYETTRDRRHFIGGVNCGK